MTNGKRLGGPVDRAETALSAEELARAAEIARRFDPCSSHAIFQFGAAPQKRMADLVASIPANIQVTSAALNRDAFNVENTPGVDRLRHARQTVLTDIVRFEMVHAESVINLREMLVYICAGEIKLGRLRSELAALEKRAVAGRGRIDYQKARRLTDVVSSVAARVHDVKLAAIVARQTVAQARLLRFNAQVLIETIQVAMNKAQASPGIEVLDRALG